jgi:hypothetical protein
MVEALCYEAGTDFIEQSFPFDDSISTDRSGTTGRTLVIGSVSPFFLHREVGREQRSD